MDDSFELNFALNSGSHLLSEAPILPSSSQEDHDSTQADLSLSELSLQDRTVTSDKPFTLLNPDRTRESAIDENEEEDENADVEEEHEDETAMRDRGRRRNEKLQSDLFVLRKLNSSFALYNEALENTGSANEQLALQLEHTEALLDRYVKILARSEDFARLIFDEDWHGGQADEEDMERERIEAAERKRREAEENALAAQRERERREREEQERIEREEKERVAREKNERLLLRAGVVRGVRGTRASMRGAAAARGVRAGSSSAGRASGIARPSSVSSRGTAPRRD